MLLHFCSKIIGAQYYRSSGDFEVTDIKSPRDTDGHGTHVASTAGGNVVNMASVQGIGLGMKRLMKLCLISCQGRGYVYIYRTHYMFSS